ncbi:MAG TPA: DUF86 domain-containing protein [Chitinophagales bacterium]|jgi:uncharacterized protein with HEPN domain|nr:DUF86 domain-containing protein [Chitinophagales bacterium]
MDERIEKYLYDIKIAIDELYLFIQQLSSLSFNEYKQNLLLKRAIERELEIVGEAMNRIIKRDENFIQQIEEAKSIISLRNYIIHSYDSVSDENIWAIIQNHLPKLKQQVEELLNHNNQ